jgi:hypothetical protein
MVLHHTHQPVSQALRALGLATAWLAAMVAGTALLMAVFSGPGDARLVGADGRPITQADVVMQATAEQALVAPPKSVVARLAIDLYEGRGLGAQ